MKKNFLKITSIVLLLMLVLSACGPTGDLPDSTDTENNSSVSTEAITTQEETTEAIYIERPSKEIKKVLMVGNSFCYYYVEELYGMARASGYEDFVVANLYESGCHVSEHWLWLLRNISMYQFYVTKKGGRVKIDSVTTLKDALAYDDWDVITYQEHFYPALALDYDKALNTTQSYAKNLFDRTREDYPDALLYWHQTWAYQVGYAVADKYVGDPKVDTPIPDVETQTTTYETIKKVSQEIAAQNGVNLIPSGDAWQIARADARVGDTMCKRKGTNGDLGDYYHDGDLGGGQYLNACVWYEVLLGESCIGNTWRPNYDLSEEKITALQEAAHEAVAAIYGPGYAK